MDSLFACEQRCSIETGSPADTMENARAILCFAQSWLNAPHEGKPEHRELHGFALVLGAVEKMLLTAEEKTRQAEGRVVAS